VEDWIHPFLQMHGHHRLRYPVADTRNPEDPHAVTVLFRYFHRFDRWREVASRGHPIPNLEQVVPQIGLEILDGHSIDSRSSLVSLDLLPRLPDLPLGDLERLACRFQLAHATPPRTHPVDRTNKPQMTRPLCSVPTAPSRGFTATTGQSAGVTRDGTQSLAGSPPGRLPVSTAGRSRQAEVSGHAFSRSVQEQQIRLAPPSRRTHLADKRAPARLIPRSDKTQVSMRSFPLRRFNNEPLRGFLVLRLPDPHLTPQTDAFSLVTQHDSLQLTHQRAV
jgi:hypothetical protein